MKAVNKVLQTNIQVNDFAFQTTDSTTDNYCIYVRAERKMVKILLNDILYIEGLNDYVKIITSVRTIITKNLLSSLEETLPKEIFIRIHRSYIVAINKIDSYNAERVEIAKKEIPIGRLFKHDVIKLLTASSISVSNSTGKNENIKKKT